MEGTKVRSGLPPLPWRMQRLPVDPDRGYPVPQFVAWFTAEGKACERGQGKPDFRVMDEKVLIESVKKRRCWICGMDLAARMAFNIGPMCAVNRISAEPPSHPECALFAAMACPFLVRPHARRRDNVPEQTREPAGCMIRRNPGVALVWVCKGYEIIPDDQGRPLFRIGDPTATHWLKEGREATREECLESIESGIPLLAEQAQSKAELAELERMKQAAMVYLPVSPTPLPSPSVNPET